MPSHHISFSHALSGLKYTFTTQPNFKIHLLATALVLFFAWIFHLEKLQWLILLFTICLVLIAEMINTSIEAATDLLAEDFKPQAKIAKDVAAGMVLVASTLSVIIGLVIFLPKILK